MQNEKLFKKIKDISLHSTAADQDWNPENVWEKITRKQQRNKAWVWWPYAAACAVLVLALLFWLPGPAYRPVRSLAHAEKIKTTAQPEALSESPYVTKNEPKSLAVSIPAKNIQAKKARTLLTAKLPQETGTALLKSTEATPAEADRYGNDTMPGYHPGQDLLALHFAQEQENEELSPLLLMYEEAKKEREIRKLSVTIEDENKKTKRWLIGSPGFLASGPNNEPDLFLRKYR
jgi:hypothetical protein